MSATENENALLTRGFRLLNEDGFSDCRPCLMSHRHLSTTGTACVVSSRKLATRSEKILTGRACASRAIGVFVNLRVMNPGGHNEPH